MIPEITVQELSERMKSNSPPFVLDVREQAESDFASIGGTLIPLPQLPQRFQELGEVKDQEIVVYCRSGARSAQAVRFLQAQGYSRVVNLRGGILAWSREIDSGVPMY